MHKKVSDEMSDEEKNPVEKAMEKDCIILFVTNEILGVVKDVLQQGRPGWFEGSYEGADHLTMKIDTKCKGPACASYSVFTNSCGLR